MKLSLELGLGIEILFPLRLDSEVSKSKNMINDFENEYYSTKIGHTCRLCFAHSVLGKKKWSGICNCMEKTLLIKKVLTFEEKVLNCASVVRNMLEIVGSK